MLINQRQYIRFSLDIPATLITKFGERQETILQQISIGGCFTGWEEYIYAGDEFRLEIELPNKNRLPLACKAVYRFDDTGIGVRFTDVSQFEQRLIASIIEHSLAREGLPVEIDPFSSPVRAVMNDKPYSDATPREERERMLEELMTTEVVE